MHRDRIWSKLERLSLGLKHNATCWFSFFNLSYALSLTLYSHPKKWVVDYSFTVAFKEPSVTYSPKIANLFGGGRSGHFGTENNEKSTLDFVSFQVIDFTQEVSLIGLGVYFALWAKGGWLQKVLGSASLTLIQKQLSNQ